MNHSTKATRSAAHLPSGETMPRRRDSSGRRSADRRSTGRGIAMRAFLGLALMVSITTSVGCFLPIYSARPERRVQQLLYTSENLRAVVDEWERFWQLDAPSHLTPIRTHGGIL